MTWIRGWSPGLVSHTTLHLGRRQVPCQDTLTWPIPGIPSRAYFRSFSLMFTERPEEGTFLMSLCWIHCISLLKLVMGGNILRKHAQTDAVLANLRHRQQSNYVVKTQSRQLVVLDWFIDKRNQCLLLKRFLGFFFHECDVSTCISTQALTAAFGMSSLLILMSVS